MYGCYEKKKINRKIIIKWLRTIASNKVLYYWDETYSRVLGVKAIR